MSKPRETIESKITAYFQYGSLVEAQLLFGIVKGIIARRAPSKSKEPKAAGKQKSEPKVEERSNGPAAYKEVLGGDA